MATVRSHAAPVAKLRAAGLAGLPLIDQPGAGFHCGCSVDLLGFLLARMFVGKGAVDGLQLLKLQTLALITTNRLTEAQRAAASNFGMSLFTARGFGLGVAVVMDPAGAAVTRCKGGVGTVGFPGAYGDWWQADPTDGSVMIFLAHNVFELEQLARGIGLGVCAAITEVHALASGG